MHMHSNVGWLKNFIGLAYVWKGSLNVYCYTLTDCLIFEENLEILEIQPTSEGSIKFQLCCWLINLLGIT